MATKLQMILAAALVVLAALQLAAAQGQSYTQLSNGLGYKYNYGIQHGHHGHAYGSSYPHGYGGFGAPGAGFGAGGFGAGGFGGGF
ncbi:keratin, type II cytoskeletal 4-like [Periplaneta americana]|uniref:keratin, type II cytoskeletal 4-like n=1 Tax=Periplaneta americana TaxID=6978 RepID=UPI0037E73252